MRRTRYFAAAVVLLLCNVTAAIVGQIIPPVQRVAPLQKNAALSAAGPSTDPTDAFASDGMITNGFTDQKTFDANFAQFSEDAHEFAGEDSEGGLGPTHNGTSCVACHPKGNGSAQRELRVGTWDGATFTAPPGGTLLRLLATVPEAQQRAPAGVNVIAERITTDLRGRAFMEFVRDNDMTAVQAAQPFALRGTLVVVTVSNFNADGTIATSTRFGRFGHKCQQGSLLDFAADADRNEKGRTSILQPFKAPAMDGRSLLQFVRSNGLDDPPVLPGAPMGTDIMAYTQFMRSLPMPARNFTLQNTPDAIAGKTLFRTVGCAICHTPTWTTAPPGAVINGFPGGVPAALGGLTFDSYTDMMTHDIGTGDGIVQGTAPRNEIRTIPLMGLQRRTIFLHDGSAKTLEDAIQRHRGQAQPITDAYNRLPDVQKRQIRDSFLPSL